MNAFSLLNKKLRNILPRYGYKKPTDIQAKAIPLILSGYNVLLVSPTGTGKTEAALFPVISRVLDETHEVEGAKVIYITPLRALNRDIFRRLTALVSELGLKIAIRHGDTPQSARRKMLDSPPDILITTPETLQVLLVGRRLRNLLKNVKYVIVDEIHEIIEDKRGVQLSVGLERLELLVGRRLQRIGISATIGNVRKAELFLCNGRRVYSILSDYTKDMEIRVVQPTIVPIEESAHDAYSQRLLFLRDTILNSSSLLIFTNTRNSAENLGVGLSKLCGEEIAVYHSSLSREQRQSIEEKFRRGEIKALVCTSALELGIDIGSVDLVVQYGSPRQAIRLVHRVGRSGHFIGGKSRGIIIALDPDDAIECIVLARRARARVLEDIESPVNSYDVLSHQMIGILLERGSINVYELWKIITRAYPYRKITIEELKQVINYLAKLGYVRVHGDEIKPRRSLIRYYMTNISTIPDITKFKIVNILDRSKIGELDESFITKCEIGSKFILGGRGWKVESIDMDTSTVYVTPSNDTLAAIPVWEGEIIPVTFKVAREVGALRRRIAQALKDPDKLRRLAEDYYVEYAHFQPIVDLIKKHLELGYPLPDDRTIVVEGCKRTYIVHACLGNRVNEGIALALLEYIRRNIGVSAVFRVDAYRILIHSEVELFQEDFKRFFSLNPNEIKNLLMSAIERSMLYRWRLLHVARRFGVIGREVKLKALDLLCRSLKETVVHEEALREVLTKDIELSRIILLFNAIRKGRIRVLFTKSDPEKGICSPLASFIVFEHYDHRVLQFGIPSKILLETVKKRLLERKMVSICLHCLWHGEYRVREVDENFKCPKCGSRVLGFTYPSIANEVLKSLSKLRKRKRLSNDELKLIKDLKLSASLFLSHGKHALMVLAGIGIGPTTAVRVLKQYIDEERLIMSIIEAERMYLRTRMYWN